MSFAVKNIRFQLLLIGLVLLLILDPFLAEIALASFILNILLSYILLTSILILHKNRILRAVSIALVLFCVSLLWLNLWGFLPFSRALSYAFFSLYLFVIVCSMLVRFFSAKRVTASVIYAALCAYLLIGLFWGFIYAWIDLFTPVAFQGELLDSALSADGRLQTLIYFSFTTLTTLGYGDIVPQTLQAASLCQVEAITGQFFISVLIAQLVGIRIAQRSQEN